VILAVDGMSVECVYVYVCVCMCVCVYVSVCVYAHTHTHIHTHTHTHTHTQTHTHSHSHSHSHTHTHIGMSVEGVPLQHVIQLITALSVSLYVYDNTCSLSLTHTHTPSLSLSLSLSLTHTHTHVHTRTHTHWHSADLSLTHILPISDTFCQFLPYPVQFVFYYTIHSCQRAHASANSFFFGRGTMLRDCTRSAHTRGASIKSNAHRSRSLSLFCSGLACGLQDLCPCHR